jgi:cytochrome c oxidase cbb3-type subunit 3
MDLRPVSMGARLQLVIGATAMCIAFAQLTACGRAENPAAHSDTTAAKPDAHLAIRYESHLAAGQQLPPGADPHNPKKSDSATLKAGETLFGAMNCDGCHGAGAPGFIGPSLSDGRWRYGGSDAEVFASIYYGRPKGMPAFGGKLGADGVWTLVSYLKSLPVDANIATQSWENQ